MDETFMRAAIALAARGLGTTWPNPSVGCIIVKNGRVIARGRTGIRGRPHAETEALRAAGPVARGATAYVSLEPCSHHGHTPPCSEALIAAGIARVVVAANDPDPRVNGAGFAKLRAAGIAVQTNFLAQEATETLAGFFTRIRQGRPLVTLKLATTLDGRIAAHTGESQWITGPEARHHVQILRGRHDAVMTGIGTILADDPDLSCRLPGYAHRPTVRIVVDSCLRTPLTANLIRSTHQNPSWILYHTDSLPAGVTSADASPAPAEIIPSRAQRLAESGARCIQIPQAHSRLDLPAALAALGTRGLTRILVEGGAQLATSLLRADLVDRLIWFHAPAAIGADGLSALQALGVENLAAMKRFAPSADGPLRCGQDVMTEFARAG